MRLWFSRRQHKANPARAAREQLRKAYRDGPPHPKGHAGPPPDDPIKNWESTEQTFLRQAGDPFLDG